MVWNRSTIFLVGVSLAVGVISTSTIAQSKKATATRDARARQLLRGECRCERPPADRAVGVASAGADVLGEPSSSSSCSPVAI
jgi:hypothetical protein